MENMENEVEKLKFELKQAKDNLQKVSEGRDRINLELIQIKRELCESKNMNEKLIKIIENLSEK